MDNSKDGKGVGTPKGGPVATKATTRHLTSPVLETPVPEFGGQNIGGGVDTESSYGDVVLRIEYVSDTEAAITMWVLRIALLVSTGLLILECVWKYSAESEQLVGQNMVYLNITLGTICMTIVLIALATFGWHAVRAAKLHKRWNPRRRVLVTLNALDLFFQLGNLVRSAVLNGPKFASLL